VTETVVSKILHLRLKLVFQLPVLEAPQNLLVRLVCVTFELQNYGQDFVFLVVFLHDSLQIQLNLLVGTKLGVFNGQLFQKLENEEEVHFLLLDQAPFYSLDKHHHFLVT
jgi:hypothetical protein